MNLTDLKRKKFLHIKYNTKYRTFGENFYLRNLCSIFAGNNCVSCLKLKSYNDNINQRYGN